MIQIELSDTQISILAAACARDDRLIFPITAKLKGGAVGNVLKSLLKKSLIEEIPATDDMTVWRTSEGGTQLTVRATPAGVAALGGDTAPEETLAATMPQPVGAAPRARQTRQGSKQEALIAMLKRPGGASINEMATAFGWQAHTVRGAIAGALKKKLGLGVTSEKVEGRGRVYRLPTE